MYAVHLFIALIILIIISIIEIWNPKLINEGFANLVSVGDSAFWSRWMPRRGDVSLDATAEQDGYIRDIRYFAGYTDVQRLGQDHDFCRMVHTDGDETDKFFACALGGTEGLSTVKFRTPSVKDGLEISRDDYMNKIDNNAAYCRILKTSIDTFEPKCNPVAIDSFRPSLLIDPNPPEDIKTLLQFYEGIMFWMRFRDDMLDYAKNVTVAISGGMTIDPIPKPITYGLEFNGIDQFLRIGDTPSLAFGNSVELKYLRATSFWVYFEEFTNNAKIFDFGNGAGQDNVVLGIMGRGNAGVQQDVQNDSHTIPDAPSGQQCTLEQSPQTAMLTSSANVNQYDCPSPEIFGRIMKPLHKKAVKGDGKTADMIYEIFENKMRKLHIQVKNIFTVKKWTHIAITTTNNDAFKPGLKIYKDGKLVHTEESAWLPQSNDTTKNYIGKSNWANVTSQMDNKDELFKGKIFDFRGYRTRMTEKKIKDTIEWGKPLIGFLE